MYFQLYWKKKKEKNYKDKKKNISAKHNWRDLQCGIHLILMFKRQFMADISCSCPLIRNFVKRRV